LEKQKETRLLLLRDALRISERTGAPRFISARHRPPLLSISPSLAVTASASCGGQSILRHLKTELATPPPISRSEFRSSGFFACELQEHLMRISALVMASSLVVAMSGGAMAQRVGDKVIEAPPRVLEVSPEDTVRMERYVREETDVPVIEEHMTLRPGSIIPEGVALRVFARDTELARFAYFVSVDNKIVIADPRTRTVVRIIDRKS
jgi:hypothetical protein